jgi:cystathionine beta-lyase/cystathionine gamma-synthase
VRQAEERLALIMGAEKALLLSSGMAAISSSLLALAQSGDNVISTPSLYGGTYRFFRDILPRHRINVRYMRPDRLDTLAALVDTHTRLVYLETPTNPALRIVDIVPLVRAVRAAERRARHKITILVDNTFATSLNQHPFDLGADGVIESATKYLGGHSDVVAGVVAGSREFVADTHHQMKYYGGCADPFAAFLLLRSLKTFTLRVERQNTNALQLAEFLERHPKVLRVLYPGLPSHPDHAVARRQMVDAGGRGYGGMVTIEVAGGVRSAIRVCDALRVAVNAMSLGGAETLASIPVLSSHVGMTGRELRRNGVTPGMIRISVGLEGIEDLQEDFQRALRRL